MRWYNGQETGCDGVTCWRRGQLRESCVASSADWVLNRPAYAQNDCLCSTILHVEGFLCATHPSWPSRGTPAKLRQLPFASYRRRTYRWLTVMFRSSTQGESSDRQSLGQLISPKPQSNRIDVGRLQTQLGCTRGLFGHGRSGRLPAHRTGWIFSFLTATSEHDDNP